MKVKTAWIWKFLLVFFSILQKVDKPTKNIKTKQTKRTLIKFSITIFHINFIFSPNVLSFLQNDLNRR